MHAAQVELCPPNDANMHAAQVELRPPEDANMLAAQVELRPSGDANMRAAQVELRPPDDANMRAAQVELRPPFGKSTSRGRGSIQAARIWLRLGRSRALPEPHNKKMLSKSHTPARVPAFFQTPMETRTHRLLHLK